MRPSQAAKEGELEGRYIKIRPARAIQLAMPTDVSPELIKFLKWALANRPENQGELYEIRDQWEGGKKALSAKYFPKPEGADPLLWEQNKKMLTHVNLVGTAIRTWVNAVYSDEAYRSVKGGSKELAAWIESDEFASSMYAWAENKCAYGKAAAVPRWDEDLEELYTWLPDPVNTVIMTDVKNPRKIQGIAEVTLERMDFVTIWGEGTLYRDDYDILEWDELDWLPAVVGGDKIMVRDALTATYAACTVMYNTRTLQKQQTKSILVRKDDLAQLNAVGAGKIKKGTDSSHIDLSKDGDAKYISPDPKIKESLEILRMIITFLATASGIPADVLDPTLSESASSAEGSRIRAIPFIQRTKPLMRSWRADEKSLVHAGQYVLEMAKDKRPKYQKIRTAVVVDIGLSPAAIPQSPNEETQDIIARVAFGLMTPEDAVRKLNYTKSKAQIIEMAREIKRRIDAETAQAMAQKALGGGRPSSQSGSGGSVNTGKKQPRAA